MKSVKKAIVTLVIILVTSCVNNACRAGKRTKPRRAYARDSIWLQEHGGGRYKNNKHRYAKHAEHSEAIRKQLSIWVRPSER